MLCWFTHKATRNFVISVCFSSVISVFSVANWVLNQNKSASISIRESTPERAALIW
jgi:hypothetical protein